MKWKMVLLGKKKLLLTFLLLAGVMVPLFIMSYYTAAENVSGPVSKMSYTSENGIKFSYPQGWLLRTEKNLSEQNGGDDEVIEGMYFTNPEQTAHGFIQLMKLSKSIPDYIEEAKKTMAKGYDSFELKETTFNDKDGYIFSYKKGSGDARIIGTEYFLKSSEKVYRIAYFYRENQAEQYEKVFEEVLNSLTLP